MIGGVIVDWLVALLCVGMGLLIWKKQKISLLHDYHYRNVKKEDVPAYSRQMGLGLITIGGGIILNGILLLAYPSVSLIPIIAGFAVGLFLIFRAQKKYNGSILG